MAAQNARSHRRLLGVLLGVCCASAFTGQSLAQQTPPNNQPSDEIVVTARKVSENLQDVPVTESVVTGTQLQERGANDIKDVLLTIPGLNYSGEDRGRSNYTIRGVSTNATSPAVGIYLDDVSLVTLANTFAGAFDPVFFDMEQLEVLKGPQGTLYGGSAMGGAIKYVSARPSLTQTEGFVSASGSLSDPGAPSGQGQVVANVPIVPNEFAIRAGVYFDHQGGYINNQAGGTIVNPGYSTQKAPNYVPEIQQSPSTYNASNYNDENTTVARLSALYDSDGLSILPSVFYQRTGYESLGLFWLDRPDFAASYRQPQPLTDTAEVLSLTIEKSLPWVDITSLSSYFRRNQQYDADYSGIVGFFIPTFFNYESFNTTFTSVRNYSQEVRFTSPPEKESSLHWLLGLYYNELLYQTYQHATSSELAPFIGTSLLYLGDQHTTLSQGAIFGEASYKIINNLELTAGFRLFKVDETYKAIGDGLFNGGYTSSDTSSNEHGFNPKLGLSYKLTDADLLYTSATKGFRPGGPNTFQIDPKLCAVSLEALGRTSAPSAYGSDDLWTYEVGSKNKFDSGKVSFDVAAFYTTWDKIQQNFTLSSCGYNFTDNAGEAVIKGVESEVAVVPLTDLHLGGNVTYNDGKITQSPLGLSAQVGDRLLGVPEWAASLYGEYDFEPLPDWSAALRADFSYQGKVRNAYERTFSVNFADGPGSIPNPTQFRGAYKVVNASLIMDKQSWQWRLYANNLGNAHPLIDPSYTYGVETSTTIRPRTVGISGRYNF